ncbi:MAG TPA: NUDIX hydrolase [Verrucomicrobiota bacterium]|nr:NUDIX hydrolase [Verrucomicrobiota bacterium]
MPDLLGIARELRAIAQGGLAYSRDPFDRERFARLHELSALLLQSDGKCPEFAWPVEIGYPTPKLDVRGAVIHDDRILLVKESSSGRWTLPGGWADVNATPAENVEREVLEESGYRVRARKIVNLVDRNRSGFPPHPEYIYKLQFLCEFVGGDPQVGLETSEVGFFACESLPELDLGRTRQEDIALAFEVYRHPENGYAFFEETDADQRMHRTQ